MEELSADKILEKIREKVFFYVSYQKRTEAELKYKFEPVFKRYNVSMDIYYDLVEELKDKGYIDDVDYVKRKFNTYTNLRPISIREIEYKILQKGIPKKIIENYISANKERLDAHQIKSVKSIYEKKIAEGKNDEEIRNFLQKKGYSKEAIKEI